MTFKSKIKFLTLHFFSYKIFGFLRDFWRYKKLSEEVVRLKNIFPCLHDRDSASQTGRSSYFYQDCWALSKIKIISPKGHVDVGSRIDGFVGQLSAFVPVTFIDIRSVQIGLPNITVAGGGGGG
jgi:hypothetical protein